MLVIGAEGFGSVERSQKLKKAEELNAQQAGQIQILSEEQFCTLAGVQTPEALKKQYQPTRDLLARYRSLRDDHIRYLVKCGIVRPVMRTNADTYFAFADVATLKQANDDLWQGLAFRMLVKALPATSSPKPRRSTSARSASSRISSRRTSTSATSTTISTASARRRRATARRCGSIRTTPTRISISP